MVIFENYYSEYEFIKSDIFMHAGKKAIVTSRCDGK